MIRKYIIYLYILIISNISFYLMTPASLSAETDYAVDYSIKKVEELANQRQRKAEKKAAAINNCFNRGKACYGSRRYKEAIEYFEDILDLDPSYEPAKLYMESAIIQLKIQKEQEQINIIKLKMADIIAEYDRRRERIDGLAVKYFLEEAQRRCQLGDYKGAEQFYNLCYRINPHSKVKIEWFIEATYKLVKLYQELNEHSKRIEEIAASMEKSTF